MAAVAHRAFRTVAATGLLMAQLGACGSELDGVDRIDVEQAKLEVDGGKAVLVDVRSSSSYDASHIQGAVSIPLAELETRMDELPRNTLIITYCS